MKQGLPLFPDWGRQMSLIFVFTGDSSFLNGTFHNNTLQNGTALQTVKLQNGT
jgi:hypothetical protein